MQNPSEQEIAPRSPTLKPGVMEQAANFQEVAG